MYLSAIVGDQHFPTLGKCYLCGSFSDAIDKALSLLISKGIRPSRQAQQVLEEKCIYVSNGVTVAIREVEYG